MRSTSPLRGPSAPKWPLDSLMQVRATSDREWYCAPSLTRLAKSRRRAIVTLGRLDTRHEASLSHTHPRALALLVRFFDTRETAPSRSSEGYISRTRDETRRAPRLGIVENDAYYIAFVMFASRYAEVSDSRSSRIQRPARFHPAGAPVTIDPDGRRCSLGRVLPRASSSDFRMYVDLSASWE